MKVLRLDNDKYVIRRRLFPFFFKEYLDTEKKYWWTAPEFVLKYCLFDCEWEAIERASKYRNDKIDEIAEKKKYKIKVKSSRSV